MKVLRADSLSALLGNQSHHLHHWLVLEETGETLSSLYQQVPALEYTWLFLETPYADFLKRSPVVLRIDETISNVLNAFSQDPREGIAPGIVVASQASQEEVLAHLRHCLNVTFYGNRKGMLRYYHPDMAAALFGAPEHVGQAWFGPLERWIWHGEAHPRTPGASTWLALHADDDPSARDRAQDHTARAQAKATPGLALSRGQEAALERHMRVMKAWKAFRQPSERLEEPDAYRRFLSSAQLQQALAPTDKPSTVADAATTSTRQGSAT